MDSICRVSFSLKLLTIFGGRQQRKAIDRLFCSRRKSTNSNIPVKYVLKNSTTHNNSKEDLKSEDERSDEYWKFNVEAFSEVKAYGLISTDYISRKRTEEIKQAFEVRQDKGVVDFNSGGCKYLEDAKNYVINLLSKRAYTTVEIRKKLLGKRFSPDVVELVITDSQDRGFLNDILFAEAYARSRWSSSSWGPRRIIDALVRKGVSKVDAMDSVNSVFHEGISKNEDSVVGMSQSSMEHLLIQASKQWLRFQTLPLVKRKARIVRWLQYRGFSWDVVSFIMRRLQSDYPHSDL